MSVALLLGLLLQTTTPDAFPQMQTPTATAPSEGDAVPARAPRNRARTEVASDCQYRARTGSIRRRNICYTPRQTAAHNAVARRYVEEIQVGQSAADIADIGPK